MTERIEVARTIPAPAADIFAVLCDPQGHVAIDSSGMLQDAEGEPATAVGDTFVIHMDRESLNDYPLGKYDVTVEIREFEKDRLIAWTILVRSNRRSVTSTATASNRPPTAPAPSSPRSTTGRTSTTNGARRTSSPSSRRAHCAQRLASWTVLCGAATRAADRLATVNSGLTLSRRQPRVDAMSEPAKIAYPVRLDDLIDVIKKVHAEPLDQLTDAVLAAE